MIQVCFGTTGRVTDSLRAAKRAGDVLLTSCSVRMNRGVKDCLRFPRDYIRPNRMKSIDVTTQAPSLDELLSVARAQAGVLLIKSGEAVAQIVPITKKPAARTSPLHPGAWHVAEDFDAPLSEDFLLGGG